MCDELFEGESFHIPTGLIHQIIGLEYTELFEFSTEHFDSDSYRILAGGTGGSGTVMTVKENGNVGGWLSCTFDCSCSLNLLRFSRPFR